MGGRRAGDRLQSAAGTVGKTRGSVAEPEPQGAGTFAGAGAKFIIQFSAPAPAPCYGIIKSSESQL